MQIIQTLTGEVLVVNIQSQFGTVTCVGFCGCLYRTRIFLILKDWKDLGGTRLVGAVGWYWKNPFNPLKSFQS